MSERSPSIQDIGWITITGSGCLKDDDVVNYMLLNKNALLKQILKLAIKFN